MERKKVQPAGKLKQNVAQRGISLFPMKNHKDQRSITTPKQKINQTTCKTKYFLESTIAILVKFVNIQSHDFSFSTNIHWV